MPTQEVENPTKDRSKSVDRQTLYCEPIQEKRYQISFQGWLKRQINSLGVRQKLGYGYAFVAGFALLIMVGGRIVEGTYRENAAARLVRTDKKTYLANELEEAVLQTQIQQQQLIFLVEEPQGLEQATSRLLRSIAIVNILLNDTKSFLQASEDEYKDLPDAEGYERLQRLVETHESTVAAYSQQVNALVEQIDSAALNKEEIPELRKSLVDFANSEVTIKFNKFSEDSVELVKLLRADEERAFAGIDTLAVFLETTILIVSVILTAAFAIALALYTSRAIAQPLEAVTKVAQQVTNDSNFDLQAPVTTEDEVGVLANSLNALIRRVSVYTRQLEIARQNLERRVEERTQELSQKNHQLEQTHEQLSLALRNLQQTQAQLIQTEKMSSLGQMIAGIAHEINNPISFIYGNIKYAQDYVKDLLELVQLYQQQYPNPGAKIQEHAETIEMEFVAEDLPKMLNSMQMGAERIRQLVVSLRNFSRLDEAPVKNVDLHEGIDSTLLILNTRIKQGISVLKQYGDLPSIECYPAQLNQVFMNILTNAIDALLGQTEQKDKQIVIQTKALDSNQVQIVIRDNGLGIPAHIQEKIFDPFFTTKPVGQGTGLGLSISYQIILKHHGIITTNSELGKGAEFVLTLPVKQQPRSDNS